MEDFAPFLFLLSSSERMHLCLNMIIFVYCWVFHSRSSLPSHWVRIPSKTLWCWKEIVFLSHLEHNCFICGDARSFIFCPRCALIWGLSHLTSPSLVSSCIPNSNIWSCCERHWSTCVPIWNPHLPPSAEGCTCRIPATHLLLILHLNTTNQGTRIHSEVVWLRKTCLGGLSFTPFSKLGLKWLLWQHKP